jgi:hypothetical protein
MAAALSRAGEVPGPDPGGTGLRGHDPRRPPHGAAPRDPALDRPERAPTPGAVGRVRRGPRPTARYASPGDRGPVRCTGAARTTLARPSARGAPALVFVGAPPPLARPGSCGRAAPDAAGPPLTFRGRIGKTCPGPPGRHAEPADARPPPSRANPRARVPASRRRLADELGLPVLLPRERPAGRDLPRVPEQQPPPLARGPARRAGDYASARSSSRRSMSPTGGAPEPRSASWKWCRFPRNREARNRRRELRMLSFPSV